MLARWTRVCSTRPSAMTMIASASMAASCGSWVTSTVHSPGPRAAGGAARVAATLRTGASKAENGSSSSTTPRVAGEGPGQAHALALASRELLRVAVAQALEVQASAATRRRGPIGVDAEDSPAARRARAGSRPNPAGT